MSDFGLGGHDGYGDHDDLASLIDAAVLDGALASGRDPALAARQFGAARVMASASAVALPPRRDRHGNPWSDGFANRWSADEEAFLCRWSGVVAEAEIAAALGRTQSAVESRRRRLELPTPKTHPDYLTALGMAAALGVDGKSVLRLIECGILRAELAPMREEKAWRMRRVAFYAWATNPDNWIFFIRSARCPERIADETLRRLIVRRAAEWDDEWWEIGRVADFHGVIHQEVNRLIRAGRIAAVKWGNWWVKRSEATRPGLRFHTYETGAFAREGTPASDAFLVLAAAVGIPRPQIGRLLGRRGSTYAASRLAALHRHDYAPWLIRAYGLPVLYRASDDALWADWRPLAYRFPRLARVWARAASGRPWTRAESADRMLVAGVVSAAARWHGATGFLERLAKGNAAAVAEGLARWEEWAATASEMSGGAKP